MLGPTPYDRSVTMSAMLLWLLVCYALLALSIDLIWGYCGILSLGHGAFFALGGYAMGMYLMRQIGRDGNYKSDLPDFMVFLDWKEFPWHWALSDSFVAQMALVVLAPGLLAGRPQQRLEGVVAHVAGSGHGRYALNDAVPRRFTATVAGSSVKALRLERRFVEKIITWDQLSRDPGYLFHDTRAGANSWVFRLLHSHAFIKLPTGNLERMFQAFEQVSVMRIIGFAKRRIDHHFFLVRMLVERMGQLHQQRAALEGLRRVGRQHLVENRHRGFMFGRQDLVPVAGRCRQALHQELAPEIGCKADRNAGESRSDQCSAARLAPRRLRRRRRAGCRKRALAQRLGRPRVDRAVRRARDVRRPRRLDPVHGHAG